MAKKYKYNVSQSRNIEFANSFPNSDIAPVIAITSNFANCVVKVLLHGNKIYVQQLACDKPSIMPFFYEKHKSIFDSKYTIIVDCSELQADFLRERNFSVLNYGRHYDFVEKVFHGEIVLISENMEHVSNGIYWSLNMFKHTTGDIQEFCENNVFIKAICLALQYYRKGYCLDLELTNI